VTVILDEEWVRQGLEPPVEPLRGMELDRLLRTSSRRIDDARLHADVGMALLKVPFKIASMIQQASNASDDSADPAEVERRSIYRIHPKADPVEVNLEAGAQGSLSGFGEDALIALPFLRTDKVELRPGEGGSLEVWEYRPSTVKNRPARRLGTIGEEEAAPYRRPVAAAGRVGQTAVCQAMRSTTAEGLFRLHLAAEGKR
jgi:hypothetical protein